MKKTIALLLVLAAPAWAVTEHHVVEKEHLWALAKHYYANPYKWRIIAAANPGIKDPNLVYPGQVVIIPDLDGRALPEVEAPVRAGAPIETGAPIAASAPIETGAPIEASVPVEVGVTPAAVSAEVSVAAVAPASEEPLPPSLDKDGLSEELPEGLSGQYPSMTRFAVPPGWKADGQITEYEEREALAAQGDFISGRLESVHVDIGEKLYVLREDALEDVDKDKDARYYVRVGVVSVQRDLGKGRYRLLILKSGDSVQLGDRLSKRRL